MSKAHLKITELHETSKVHSNQENRGEIGALKVNTGPTALGRGGDDFDIDVDWNLNGTSTGLSPGALRRAQSSTHPSPFPLPELMRLTCRKHRVLMTDAIHSMASFSRRGKENFQSKTNQDSFFAYRQFLEPYQALAAVMDGHGPHGHIVSSLVKEVLPTKISEHLRRRGETVAGAALTSAFLDVQAALHKAAMSGKVNARLSGSTAVVSLIQGYRIVTAWTGDSRAIVVRKGNGLDESRLWTGMQLTEDHTPACAKEVSRIIAAGGCVERLKDGRGRTVGPERVWLPGQWVPGLAMTRALGDFVAHTVGVTAEPEIRIHELQKGEEQYLVIASDGVWEFMSNDEVAGVVGPCASAEEACRMLVDAASDRWAEYSEGGMDDITVVVTKYH